MQITTSLRLCREHGACETQYDLLVAALDPGWGDDQPIPLTMLLDLHGVPGWFAMSNTAWAMGAVPLDQAETRDRLSAAYCVDTLGGIPGPPEHNHAVQVLRAFAGGLASIEDVKKAAHAVWAGWYAWAEWTMWVIRSVWAPWETGNAWAVWARCDGLVGIGIGVKDLKNRSILRWLLDEEATRDE